jgi:hypothetical protein
MACDVASFIHEHGMKDPTVIGHSMSVSQYDLVMALQLT